jgi:hypothetical protein
VQAKSRPDTRNPLKKIEVRGSTHPLSPKVPRGCPLFPILRILHIPQWTLLNMLPGKLGYIPHVLHPDTYFHKDPHPHIPLLLPWAVPQNVKWTSPVLAFLL